MAPQPNVAAGLRHTEAKSILSALRKQSRRLEERHREYQRALSSVSNTMLYHVGDTGFLKVDSGTCEQVLRGESARLFQEIEDVQREIVRLEREVIMIEIEARLQTLAGGR